MKLKPVNFGIVGQVLIVKSLIFLLADRVSCQMRGHGEVERFIVATVVKLSRLTKLQVDRANGAVAGRTCGESLKTATVLGRSCWKSHVAEEDVGKARSGSGKDLIVIL